MASSPKATLHAGDGKKTGEVELDSSWFGIEPNVSVMHQVVTAQLAAARSGSANTKTRAQVRGGGRKPWRQKGLGRARHGSIRSPQWRGGGVVFGPTPRSYEQRTPKKMKRLALASALSARAGEGQVKVIEELAWTEPKTKQAKSLLSAIGAGPKALVVIGVENEVARRSFRNLTDVIIIDAGQVNTYDVLWAETVVFSQAALDALTGRGSEDRGSREEPSSDASEPAPEKKSEPKSEAAAEPVEVASDAAPEAEAAVEVEPEPRADPKPKTAKPKGDEPEADFELVTDDGDPE